MSFGNEREIIVTVPLGKNKPVKIETKGFKGEACIKATEGLQQALGQTVSETPTEEMYEKPLEVDHHIRESHR